MMETIVISLGSNLGNREFYLDSSVRHLSKKLKYISCSSTYESEGMGVFNHPSYLNRVIYCKTNLSFTSLLNYTKKIEKIIGRKSKNDLSPRVIDIDIIFYGERKVHRKNLILPHNNFAKRPFVVVPINELDKKMKRKLTKKFKYFLIHTNISSKLSGNIVQKVS